MRPVRASTIARRYHHFASEPWSAVAEAYASRAAPTMPFASQIIPKRPQRCGVARILREAVERLASRGGHFGRNGPKALHAGQPRRQ